VRKFFRVSIPIASLVALLIALPGRVYALGEQTGRIVGHVFEEQTRAPVPGATVTVTGPTLIGSPRQTQTAEEGFFEVSNLPPGTYDVEVSYQGVKPIKRRILVRAAEAAPLEIAWSPELAQVETTIVTEERNLTRPETTNTGATFSMEKQNNLPVPRQYQSVVTQAPGVNENSIGNPQVKGGNARNNRYLVDGLDTTDPVTNTFSFNANQDSLAAVQVITGGMEAKYNSVGSVINLITQSGSDQLHFDVSFYARPKWLQVFHPGGPQIYEQGKLNDVTAVPPQQNYQGNFNIGGPIILHKLWYSAGAEIDYNSRVQPLGSPLNSQAPNRVFQNIYPRLKLTYAPSSQHRFMLEGLGDPTTIDYENNAGGTANTTDPMASFGRFQGGWKAIGEWDYFISQNVDTKLLGGWSGQKLDVGPQAVIRGLDSRNSGDIYGPYSFDAPQHVNNLDGTVWRNTSQRQITYRNRFQLDGSMTLRGRLFERPHEAEFGFQSSYDFSRNPQIYTGGGTFYTDDSTAQNGFSGGPLNTALCDQDPFIQPDPTQRTGRGCFARTDRNDFETRSKLYTLGFYIQDRWKPTSWLTIIPGLRWDIGRVWSANPLPDSSFRDVVIGNRTVHTADYMMVSGFGPRLSGLLDITRDQKTIFQATYGRATQMPYLTFANNWYASTASTRKDSVWNGSGFVLSPSGGSPENLADSSSRTPTYVDELLFSLRRQLFRNSVGIVEYTYRHYSNILEAVETNFIYDPGGVRVVDFVDRSHPNSVAVWSNDPRNTLNYSGFDFIFESKPTPYFDFYGAYTLSWTYGPGFGELANGDQFGNPRQSQFFGGYAAATSATSLGGTLGNNDIRHIIKTQGVFNYQGMIIGTTLNWRSGYALRKNYPVTDTSIITPRYRSPTGTDPSVPNDFRNWTEFRVPDLFSMNVLVGYDFYALTRQHITVQFSVENLFDNFTPVNLRNNETAPPTQFGQVTARPDPPLRGALGIRYSY
jgi:hypothetical protein